MKDMIVEGEIVIDFLEGVEGAKSALEKAAAEGVLRISAISAAEVMAAAGGARREPTVNLLSSFWIAPVSKEVALLAGLYLSNGNRDKLGLSDCIVAATCSQLGAVLVTRGRRKYPSDGFETLVVEY